MTYRDSYAGPIKTHTAHSWPAIYGTQTTASEGHPFHSRKRGEIAGDLGGPFFTTRNSVAVGGNETFFATGEYPGPYKWSAYRGPLLSYPANASWPPEFPPSGHSSDTALNAKGATAIARSSPTSPVFNAATFLGELLKDGLPSRPGEHTREAVKNIRSSRDLERGLGSEYLNTVFGWQPIVSDVNKFAYAVRHAHKVLAQYERDAGKVVRRRYNFPVSVERETVSYGDGNAKYFPNNNDLNGVAPYGSWVRERTTTRSQWFSGAYTYYLPSDYDSRHALARYATQADKLFGVSLTPDTLWELAPWSWAVDWFSNAGDVLANVSNRLSDGLVLRYGYLMETTVSVDTYRMTNLIRGQDLPLAPISLITTTKKRVRANPYGFGVTWESLSNSQLAILAALGFSKS